MGEGSRTRQRMTQFLNPVDGHYLFCWGVGGQSAIVGLQPWEMVLAYAGLNRIACLQAVGLKHGLV